MEGVFRRLGGAGAAGAVLLVMGFGLAASPAHATGTAARPQLATVAGAVGLELEPTTEPVKELCHDCLGTDDAICWEFPPYACRIQVNIGWIAKTEVTVHFTTLDGSARAGLDYVPVDKGVITIPVGTQQGTSVVQLLPTKPGGKDTSFLIELSAPSQGRISRGTAVITIVDGPPPGKGGVPQT